MGVLDEFNPVYVELLSSLNDFNQDLPVFRNLGGAILACFNEGTLILCLSKDLEEVWIPIEKLSKEYLVKTYKHGYRRIEAIGKGVSHNVKGDWVNSMYIMHKVDGMTGDLIVTGGHSILVDEIPKESHNDNLQKFNGKIPEIDGKKLLLASSSNLFKPLEDDKEHTYYHLILENDGDDEVRFGIWANGVLTETPSKKFFYEKFTTLV
jgi:hypothetical protein